MHYGGERRGSRGFKHEAVGGACRERPLDWELPHCGVGRAAVGEVVNGPLFKRCRVGALHKIHLEVGAHVETCDQLDGVDDGVLGGGPERASELWT